MLSTRIKSLLFATILNNLGECSKMSPQSLVNKKQPSTRVITLDKHSIKLKLERCFSKISGKEDLRVPVLSAESRLEI